MKVIKLSKTKSKTNKNNKINTKRKNKTKTNINRLKGGDKSIYGLHLFTFINSLPEYKKFFNKPRSTENNLVKIISYFDIKIILLYIIAYELLNKDKLQEIFKYFQNGTDKNLVMLLSVKSDTDLMRLNPIVKFLNSIYEHINTACNSIKTIYFVYENNIKYNSSKPYSEYTEFTKYFTVVDNESISITPIDQSTIKQKMSRSSIIKRLTTPTIKTKFSDSPKIPLIKTLLGETNFFHFMANYPNLFDIEGQLVTDFNPKIDNDLQSNTLLSKNSNKTKKCPNVITKKSVNANNATSDYDCFLQNCKSLINFENKREDIDINTVNENRPFKRESKLVSTVSGGITLPGRQNSKKKGHIGGPLIFNKSIKHMEKAEKVLTSLQTASENNTRSRSAFELGNTSTV
jgi:hypothetical protein